MTIQTLFTRAELEALRDLAEARMNAIASMREAFAMRLDTSAEVKRMSLLSQTITLELESLSKVERPISDHAELSALGFSCEVDHDPKLYALMISRHKSEHGGATARFALLYLSATNKSADLYVYETTWTEWIYIEPDPDDLKAAVEGIETIGELMIALEVAQVFGRKPIGLDETTEPDEDELSPDLEALIDFEADLSGTLKSADHDLVADIDDEIGL